MAISDPGRGLVRRLGVTAAALLAFAAASQQRAEALSLASPGTAPSAKFATDDLTTEVRHGGHGGRWPWRRRLSRRAAVFMAVDSGRRCAFHGGGFRGGGVAIHRGGFRAAPVFRGGGMRYGVSPRLSPAALPPPASLPPAVLRAELLRIPVLLWLPAPLLPRDLDLLRAAQDLPLSSVVSPPLARSLLRIPYRYW